VLIQWGANWCGWCHLLHEKFKSDPKLAHELMYEYDVVLIDIGKGDKNMDLAEGYGADLKKGFPTSRCSTRTAKRSPTKRRGSLRPRPPTATMRRSNPAMMAQSCLIS
jgi:thiol-disulfide isomerase/thioredoxin